MPNNKYSITCVHLSVFSQLKKCQALFLKWPAGGPWEHFGGTAFFQLRRFSCYDLEYPQRQHIISISLLSHFTSRMVGLYLSRPSPIYGWVNSDIDERCVLQLSTNLPKKKRKGQINL